MQDCYGHAPHGACGLKSQVFVLYYSILTSCPAWGMWIEIFPLRGRPGGISSHAPHGACGLKYSLQLQLSGNIWSCPAWGMWIEMYDICIRNNHTGRSCPAWGMWIEIMTAEDIYRKVRSCPAWGMWIEINLGEFTLLCFRQSCPAWGMWIEIPTDHKV